MSKCPNCKQDGPHFVGPSFGEKGFYVCEAKQEPVNAPVVPAMTDHAQREVIEAGDPNFPADILWEKAVGVCVGDNCGRQFISRERFDTVIVPALTQAHAAGRRAGLEEAAKLADIYANCMEEDLPQHEVMLRLLQQTVCNMIATKCRAKAEEVGHE